MDLNLHEIVDESDEHFLEVLDIYQDSFPLREQMRFSWWLRFLRRKAAGGAADATLLTALVDGKVAALTYYQKEADIEGVVYLWYFAVREDLRNAGIGTQFYRDVRDRIFSAGAKVVVFEVELPEEAQVFSEREAELAARRIEFYRRQHAKLLGGVVYTHDIGWQPPYPMGVMLASKEVLTPEDGFAVVKAVLEDSVCQVGPLTLT